MDAKYEGSPVPVEGVIFERSRARTLGLTVCWVVLSAWGMCMFSGALNGNADLGIKGLLFGIVLMIGAPIMILREVRSLWVRRRLIIGSDCIQVIERLAGEDRVVLQLPFANIAEVKYEENRRRVGIDLHRLDDADTYAPWEKFKGNRQSSGRHYCIPVGYRSGPRVIASKIEKAYSLWAGELN